MYLTRGGSVGLTTGSLRRAGFYGLYWASSAYPSSLYAFDLYFNSPNVYPSDYDARWYGFTVRASLIKTSRNLPMYLTRGGNMALSTGSAWSMGSGIAYWTGTAYLSPLYGYYNLINLINSYPNYANNRWLGFTVWSLPWGWSFGII